MKKNIPSFVAGMAAMAILSMLMVGAFGLWYVMRNGRGSL